MCWGGGGQTLRFSHVPSFYGHVHRSSLKTRHLNRARRLVAARPLLLTLNGPERGPTGVLGIPVSARVSVSECVCARAGVRAGEEDMCSCSFEPHGRPSNNFFLIHSHQSDKDFGLTVSKLKTSIWQITFSLSFWRLFVPRLSF